MIRYKDLTFDDVFNFADVLGAIGTDQLAGVFNADEISAMRSGGKTSKAVGTMLALKAAAVLAKNFGPARDQIYRFLAGCTIHSDGRPVTMDELKVLKIREALDLVKGFADLPDLQDFFTQAAEFTGTGQKPSGSSATDVTPDQTSTLTLVSDRES